MKQHFLRVLAISLTFTLAACETVTEPEPEPVVVQVAAPVQVSQPNTVVLQPSTAPILNPSKSDIIFAQSSLKTLGYPVGKVDGVWGQQSKQAIQEFERYENIPSAKGSLSELNLTIMKSLSETSR